MTLVRRLALVVAAVAAVAAGACVEPPGEGTEEDTGDQAATRPVKLVHWNVAGAVLNLGFNNVIDRLYDEVVARGADLVSINEGCRDQVEHLRDRLRARGLPVTLGFAPTGNNAACIHSLGTNTAQSGPAVLVVNGGTNHVNYYWQGTASVDNRTDRGMACLTANLGKPIRVCSLHLATDDATAAAQAQSMLVRFGSSFVTGPAILVGDFNAPPAYLRAHTPSLYAPGGLFYEADAAVERATHGEGKLDYVFMSKAHFAPASAAFVSKDMGRHDPWWAGERAFSDHRLVYAEVALGL